MEKYDEVLNIILPTLRSDRRKTYCPFLPICPETGKVLEIPVIEMDKKNNTLVFDNNGKRSKLLYDNKIHSVETGNKAIEEYNVSTNNTCNKSKKNVKAKRGSLF